MRVLLDECLPRRLKGGSSTTKRGRLPRWWAGKQNGELFAPAVGQFECSSLQIAICEWV